MPPENPIQPQQPVVPQPGQPVVPQPQQPNPYQPQQPVTPVPPAPTGQPPVYGEPAAAPGLAVDPTPLATAPVAPQATMDVPPPLGTTPVAPQATMDVPPPKPGSIVPFIIIVVVVLLLTGGGYAFYTYSKKAPATSSGTTTPTVTITKSPQDVVDRTDGKLDLSGLVDSNNTIKNQTITGKINQQLNMSDGTSFMVTKVQHGFVSTSSFDKPAAGHEYVKVTVVVGAHDQKNSVALSTSLFSLKTSTGAMLDPNFAATDDIAGNNIGSSKNVKPSEQLSGDIVYEVPTGDKSLTLVYKKQYDNVTTKVTVTLDGEVALQ